MLYLLGVYFLLLSNIPQYVYYIICSFVPLLMVFWVISPVPFDFTQHCSGDPILLSASVLMRINA